MASPSSVGVMGSRFNSPCYRRGGPSESAPVELRDSHDLPPVESSAGGHPSGEGPVDLDSRGPPAEVLAGIRPGGRLPVPRGSSQRRTPCQPPAPSTFARDRRPPRAIGLVRDY